MAGELLFNKEARLRVQVTEGGLTIIAAPRKGEADEEDALQAVEQILRELTKRGVSLITFKRKTLTGDRRVDMISTTDVA